VAPLFLKQNRLLIDDVTLAADGSVGNGNATAVQAAKPGRPPANAAVGALAAGHEVGSGHAAADGNATAMTGAVTVAPRPGIVCGSCIDLP
jgi:hypothetical protein